MPTLDEVQERFLVLLREFPGSRIDIELAYCDCKHCLANPDKATIDAKLTGTRVDGRELESAFQHITLFAGDWERWDARADLIRLWLNEAVNWDFPSELRKRLGRELTGHILLVESLQN